MKHIFAFLLVVPALLFAQGSIHYTDFHVGDTVRPLKPQSDYAMRVYVFTDRSNCVICMINIERFYEQLREYPVEYVVFLDGFSQSDAEAFRREEKIEFPIVGDEFQIYRNFYKIRMLPVILILDRVGKILAIESPTSQTVGTTLRSLRDSLANTVVIERTDLERYFELLWKLPVRDTAGHMLKSGWSRLMLVGPERKSFFLVNGTQCQLLIIDSTGTIRARTPIRLDSLHCMGIGSIDWATPGKSLLIYGSTFEYPHYLALYTIGEPTLHNVSYLSRQLPLDIECGYCDGKIYSSRRGTSLHPLLTPEDTTIWVGDITGKTVAIGRGIDSIYYQFRLTRWLSAIFGCYEDSTTVSLFQFGRSLRVWDRRGNLIKVIPLHFSDTYRVPSWDLPERNGKLTIKDGTPLDGLVSNIAFRKIFYDKTTGMFLLPYRNTEYPEGVVDFSDARVQHREYLHFCWPDGSPVFTHDLYAGNHFIPHDFRDGILIGTVLDSSNYLWIVAYKLNGSVRK